MVLDLAREDLLGSLVVEVDEKGKRVGGDELGLLKYIFVIKNMSL